MDSILQNEKYCFITERTDNLQQHHIFFGHGQRKLSDKYGCWVWLAMDYHTGYYGVHTHRELDLQLKMACQKAFENIHSHEKFMQVFGRNYL